MLYVDEDRASRVSLEETAFEQAIERLKRELEAARVDRERTIREEMENTDLREEGESVEAKSGFWRT
jgi:ribosomal protein S21